MIKLFTAILLLCVQINCPGQNEGDNKIAVTVADTSKLYQRTRQAIVNTNLIIREDSKWDTTDNENKKIEKTNIFVIARVTIKSNSIEITGAYGLGYEDFWGYPGWPKGYKPILYFKGSDAWKVLRRIAIKLDGKITYHKDR